MDMSNNVASSIGVISDISAVNKYIVDSVIVTEFVDDFTIIEANDSYFNLVGYTRQEVKELFNNSALKLVHKDDAEAANEEVRNQLNSGEGTFELTCRAVNKYDGYKFVKVSGRVVDDAAKGKLLYASVVDITVQIAVIENYRRENEFAKMIEQLSSNIFFDYSFETKTLRLSKPLAKRLNVPEFLEKFPEAYVFKGNFFSDNALVFANVLANASDIKHIKESEIQFSLPDGEGAWFTCTYKSFDTAQKKNGRIVGKLTDITNQRVKIMELEELSSRDALTQLYNKAATENMIKKALVSRAGSEGTDALMIIDIDFFKTANDSLGHMVGDKILYDLSAELSNLFRSDDIVGRVGGDEFFVFMKNCKSESMIYTKAEMICEAFNVTYGQDVGKEVHLSASVGIALCPDHGNNLGVLYTAADKALYVTKANGKNGFTVYDEEVENVPVDENLLKGR